MATIDYVHPTEYRFYTQRYPDSDGVNFIKTDIEAEYDCRYMKFDGLTSTGDVKNIYTEDYAEASGVRTYIPEPDQLAYSSYECTLSLRFKGDNAKENRDRFLRDHLGVLIEWSDTFRYKKATLLMTKQPTIQFESLIGEPYIVMDYTFTNTLGRTYDESLLK